MVYRKSVTRRPSISVLLILGISIFVFIVLHVMGYVWLKYR